MFFGRRCAGRCAWRRAEPAAVWPAEIRPPLEGFKGCEILRQLVATNFHSNGGPVAKLICLLLNAVQLFLKPVIDADEVLKPGRRINLGHKLPREVLDFLVELQKL